MQKTLAYKVLFPRVQSSRFLASLCALIHASEDLHKLAQVFTNIAVSKEHFVILDNFLPLNVYVYRSKHYIWEA